MTKFWMTTMVAILALGLTTTGCPDGDDSCSDGHCDVCGNDYCGEAEYASGSCPADCGSGFCGDGICEEFLAGGRETCATCPADCRTGCGSDADADADSDSDTTEDDGDTTEVANCPSVAGEWALTYRNAPYEDYFTLILEQDGCSLTGHEDGGCDITGIINEDGTLSLFRDCGSRDRIITGNFTQTPPRMQGEWRIEEPPAISGDWWADPQ